MGLLRQQNGKETRKTSRKIVKLCDENKDNNVKPNSSRKPKHHENFNAGDDILLQPRVKLYDVNSVPVLKIHSDRRRALSDRNNSLSDSSNVHLTPIVKLYRIDHTPMLKSPCNESITFHDKTSITTMPLANKQANAADGQSNKDFKMPVIESKVVDSPIMHLRSADRRSPCVSLEMKETLSKTPSSEKNIKSLDTGCSAESVVHELRNRKISLLPKEQDILISSVIKKSSGQSPTLRKRSIGSKTPSTSGKIRNQSDDLPNLNSTKNSQTYEFNNRNEQLQKIIVKSKNASFEDNMQSAIMCRTRRGRLSNDRTSENYVKQSIDKNVNLSPTSKTVKLVKNKVRHAHQPKSHDTSLKCTECVIRQSPRTLNSKKYLSNFKSPCGNVVKNIQSSPESHECIYSKAPRDTLKNKNMPVDEKLALYEFEVDENEPVIKRKKRRNVNMKRGQKKHGDRKFHGKVSLKKLQNKCYQTRIQKQEQDNEVRNVQIQESCDKISEVRVAMNVNNYQETSEVNSSHDVQFEKPSNGVQNTKHVHFDKVIEIGEDSSIFPLPISENKENPACTMTPVERKLVTNPIVHSKPLGEIQLNQVCETPKSGNLKPVKVTGRQLMKCDLECISPVARSLQRETIFRKIKDSSLISELDVSNQEPVENHGQLMDNVVEEELEEHSLSCPNISSNKEIIDSIVEHPDLNHSRDDKINAGEAKASSVPQLPSHSTPAKVNLLLNISCSNEKQGMFSPIVQSPNFSPLLQRNGQTGNAINSSLTKGTSYQPLCRASGIGIHTYERKRSEKWNIDNCFGFDEGCDDINLSSPFSETSANKPKSTLPFSSTPVMANHSSHQPSRSSLKRKLNSNDHDDNTACKSSCVEGIKENKNNEVTSQNSTSVRSCRSSLFSKPLSLEKNNENQENYVSAQNSALPSCSKITPFSNPLEQSKLNFSAVSLRKPNNKESKWHASSPALFQDDVDKTPIHFKEPARRSYNRLHRRSMQFVGDEWIEVEHEDDEEREKSVAKRSKKHKKNKEEIEAKKWMKEFNNQCGEIEEFELCVE